MIPRIQGKVGKGDDGNFYFEVWLTEIGGGQGDSLGVFGPWETEGLAKTELKKCAQMIVEIYEKKVQGSVSGKYIDMNTNELRTWQEN